MQQPTYKQGQMIAHFYTAYRAELVNYTNIRLGNREESEDLVQDVFYKMMTIDGFINEVTLKSFAFTITANKIKDVPRRRIFRHQMEESKKYESQLQHTSAERMAEYHDVVRLINTNMEKLSPACAKVYRMSLFDDMSVGDICEELQVSKRTIESQLFTSRKKMRELMKEAI